MQVPRVGQSDPCSSLCWVAELRQEPARSPGRGSGVVGLQRCTLGPLWSSAALCRASPGVSASSAAPGSGRSSLRRGVRLLIRGYLQLLELGASHVRTLVQEEDLSALTPKQVVERLDKYIVGQVRPCGLHYADAQACNRTGSRHRHCAGRGKARCRQRHAHAVAKAQSA